VKLLDLQVAVGEAQVLGGLLVFPLSSAGDPRAARYLPGPDALDTGVASVHELVPPQVPSLEVRNSTDIPVLLIEGECLLGGDQNRTLNVSVLCPPLSATIVPVSCVEAGRWGGCRMMATSRQQSPGNLRRSKTRSIVEQGEDDTGNRSARRSDQQQIWDEVDRYSERHAAASPTCALADIQNQAQPRINELAQTLRLNPGQTGAAYSIGGRVVGLDLFDRASTCKRYLPGIVGGYMLDSLDEPPEEVSIADVERFLSILDNSERDELPGVGLGVEIRFSSDSIIGIGVALDECLVHLAAFANE
jgi:ARG and Rhodanese-Phosphatase-superfamily-associated Protein domain